MHKSKGQPEYQAGVQAPMSPRAKPDIHAAVVEGNLKEIQRLVQQGISLETTDKVRHFDGKAGSARSDGCIALTGDHPGPPGRRVGMDMTSCISPWCIPMETCLNAVTSRSYSRCRFWCFWRRSPEIWKKVVTGGQWDGTCSGS